MCWGDNEFGALGNGTTTNPVAPVEVAGLSNGVAAIAVGWYHTCALTAVGGIKCWGDNEYGQLGDGTTTHRRMPVEVAGLSSNVVAIAAGSSHTCALTAAGGVKCWGYNFYGQLGDGTKTDRLTPVDVFGLSSGISAIAAGGDHTCALTAAGGVKCWGDNFLGALRRWYDGGPTDAGGCLRAVQRDKGDRTGKRPYLRSVRYRWGHVLGD